MEGGHGFRDLIADYHVHLQSRSLAFRIALWNTVNSTLKIIKKFRGCLLPFLSLPSFRDSATNILRPVDGHGIHPFLQLALQSYCDSTHPKSLQGSLPEYLLIAITASSGRRLFDPKKASAQVASFLRLPKLKLMKVDFETISEVQSIIESHDLKPRDAIHAATALTNDIHRILSFDHDFDAIPSLTQITP